MNSKDLEERLSTCESLPVLPMSLSHIQKLMGMPKSTMAQIAYAISADQTLASKTIKLVNSAFYGMRKPVSSITQAIVILGLNTINNIMLGLSAVKMFGSAKGKTLDQELFWEHAFGVALMSKELANATGYDEPDECFIAGLLHDIGRLVMEQYFHNDFSKAFMGARSMNISLSEAEQLVFGADHCFAGGYLAKKWKLPVFLYACIRYHHSIDSMPPEFAEYGRMAAIVAMANYLAVSKKIGDSGETDVPPVTDQLLSCINTETIEKIVEQARESVKATLTEWQS
jgi:HD-like signal output (HDOD) protein